MNCFCILSFNFNSVLVDINIIILSSITLFRNCSQIDPSSSLSFDQTCCKLKGVPKECMGNCIDDDASPSSRVMGLPPAFCDNYKESIEHCVVVGKTGIV